MFTIKYKEDDTTQTNTKKKGQRNKTVTKKALTCRTIRTQEIQLSHLPPGIQLQTRFRVPIVSLWKSQEFIESSGTYTVFGTTEEKLNYSNVIDSLF